MAKYRTRSIVVEAEQVLDLPYPEGVRAWPEEAWWLQPDDDMSVGYIDTPEGRLHVLRGEWIITGAGGERYPCKNSVFAASYQLVDDELPA